MCVFCSKHCFPHFFPSLPCLSPIPFCWINESGSVCMKIQCSVSFPQVSSSDCTVEDVEFDPDLINCDVLVGHL